MRNLVKIEIKKAFSNRMFLLTLGIGLVMAAISAYQNIECYYSWVANEINAANVIKELRNPDYAYITLYNSWMGQDSQFPMTALFYMIMPMLACLVYGWSYYNERKSGYVRNISVRTRKRSHYFLAKYIAVFLSGGAVIVLPLLFNFLAAACFIPAYLPEMFDSMYYGMETHYLKAIFYSMPQLYVIYVLLLDFVFGGLIAACSMMLAFFIKNKFAVIITPFLILFWVQYLQDNVWFSVSSFYISPIDFTRGYAFHIAIGEIVLGWVILLMVLTLGIVWRKGAKDDVL